MELQANTMVAQAEAAGKGAHEILLIEDSTPSLRQLAAALGSAGYAVNRTADANSALDQLREGNVGLILLADKIQGMNGLELLRLLRAAWPPEQMPIVLIGDDIKELAARQAGASEYWPAAECAAKVGEVESLVRQKACVDDARARAERIYRAAIGSSDVVWEWNLSTEEVWFSTEWEQLCESPGNKPQRLTDWLAFVHPDDSRDMHAALYDLRRSKDGSAFRHEYRLRTPSGQTKWMLCRGGMERDRKGKPLRITGLQTDISSSKGTDLLTRLPNRDHLLHHLDRLVQDRVPFALVLLDIDRFRLVNESFEHQAGDRLLREIATRLQRETRMLSGSDRTRDFLARVGGDSFALVISGIKYDDIARALADRLQTQVRRPFDFIGRQLRLSGSIGVVLNRVGDYQRGHEVLLDAEIAMRQAKSEGRARTVLFDGNMRRDALQLMTLEVDLRHALERKQFEMVYQPKVDMDTGLLSGFEALIRWNHPERGVVSPLHFIPIAEETGLILPIGAWAIEETARQYSQWIHTPEGASLTVSVNLSVKQFFDHRLFEIIGAAMRGMNAPPGFFGLEITESVFIGEMATAVDILRRLRAKGLGLLIDDFGTGYSSLNYLMNLPFDTLKIDRLFVSRLPEDENCAEVVNAVMALARSLRMNVIAEGVENACQIEHLKQIGCRYAQGFYFSKPICAQDATRLVQRGRPLRD